MPRSNAGVSSRGMPLSKMMQASAPRSSAARKWTIESPPISSSPSKATRTLTGSAPSSASEPGGLEDEIGVALVVDGAPRVQVAVADLGLERVGLPEVERRRRLDVEVAVEEDGRRLVRARGGADLPDRERMPVRVDELGLAAGRADELAHPLAGARGRRLRAPRPRSRSGCGATRRARRARRGRAGRSSTAESTVRTPTASPARVNVIAYPGRRARDLPRRLAGRGRSTPGRPDRHARGAAHRRRDDPPRRRHARRRRAGRGGRALAPRHLGAPAAAGARPSD